MTLKLIVCCYLALRSIMLLHAASFVTGGVNLLAPNGARLLHVAARSVALWSAGVYAVLLFLVALLA